MMCCCLGVVLSFSFKRELLSNGLVYPWDSVRLMEWAHEEYMRHELKRARNPTGLLASNLNALWTADASESDKTMDEQGGPHEMA